MRFPFFYTFFNFFLSKIFSLSSYTAIIILLNPESHSLQLSSRTPFLACVEGFLPMRIYVSDKTTAVPDDTKNNFRYSSNINVKTSKEDCISFSCTSCTGTDFLRPHSWVCLPWHCTSHRAVYLNLHRPKARSTGQGQSRRSAATQPAGAAPFRSFRFYLNSPYLLQSRGYSYSHLIEVLICFQISSQKENSPQLRYQP